MLDLDTFITMIYVLIDDWYRTAMLPSKPKLGKPPRFSDSEALTVGVLSEWRSGVPWQSERSCWRYLERYYGDWFPQLPHISAFNERKRHLFGVFVRLQQHLAQQLISHAVVYECVDSLPLPAGSLGQYQRGRGHWLWDSTVGKAPHGWFWGDRWLASVTDEGVITGWLVGAAHLNDRWLLQAFVSGRAGCPELREPPRRKRDAKWQHTPAPHAFLGGWTALGHAMGDVYLADGNFGGQRWLTQWQERYGAWVLTKPGYNDPRVWSKEWTIWLKRHRQVIETTFAILEQVFAIKRLQAHSRWGQYTRLAVKTSAYHLGMWFNRLLGRPLLAIGTLLC